MARIDRVLFETPLHSEMKQKTNICEICNGEKQSYYSTPFFYNPQSIKAFNSEIKRIKINDFNNTVKSHENQKREFEAGRK